MSGKSKTSLNPIEIEIDKCRLQNQWGVLPKLAKDLLKKLGKENCALIATAYGERALASGDTKIAEENLVKALDDDAEYEDALARLGAMYQQSTSQDDHAKALAFLDRINWQRNRVFWVSGEAVESTPHRWKVLLEALISRGILAEEFGEYEKALRSYVQAFSLAGEGRLVDGTETMLEETLLRACKLYQRLRSVTAGIVWMRKTATQLYQFQVPASHRLLYSLYRRLGSFLLKCCCQADYPVPNPAEYNQKDLFVPGTMLEEAVLLLSVCYRCDCSTCIRHKNDILNDLTIALCRAKQYGDLSEIFRHAVAGDQVNACMWLRLSWSLCGAGKHDEAYLAAKNAIAGKKEECLALLTAATLCINHVNKAKQAVRHSRQALTLCQAGGPDATHITTARHVYGVACMKHAWEMSNFNSRKTLQQQALDALSKAYDEAGQNHSVVFHLATLLADVRKITQAIRITKHSLSLNSHHVDSWNLLALLLTSNKQYLEATHACDAGLAENHSSKGLLLTKAKVLAVMGRVEEALECYGQLCELEDDMDGSVKYMQFRGTNKLLFDTDTIKEDEKEPEVSLSLTSYVPPHLKQTCANASKIELLFDLADLYASQEGMQDDAANCLAKAKEYVSASGHSAWIPDIQARLGILQEQISGTSAAIPFYETALASEGSHTPSLIRMGVIESERGNYVMAHGYLTSALRVDSTSHEAWYHMGVVLECQGKHEESSEAFLTALELERTTPTRCFSNIPRTL